MKMKNLFTMAVVVLSTFTALAQDAAKPQKIGTMNMDYILSNIPEIKAVQSQLTTLQSQLQKQGEAKEQQYKEKYINYQMEGQKMTTVDRQRLEGELTAMEQDIQQFGTSAQEKLQAKQIELMEPINKKIGDAMQAVVTEELFTHIFNTGVPQAGLDIWYYADPAYDISNSSLKKLGVTPPTPPSN
jgi:outer membrane protein